MCVGIPARIVAITDAGNRLAKADIGGVRRDVNVACIVDDGEDINELLGAWVLIHVGFAMSRIDEREAAETLALLTELGEAQRELEAMRGDE